jgi:AcrR family transcriptional regulator
MEGNNEKTRVPQQERSRETRNRLIAAGERLFSQKGFHHTTSKEIAREAGVAIGSFYAYFADKKAVFTDVLKRHSQQVFDSISKVMLEDIGNTDPRALLTALIKAIIVAHEISPEFHRELTVMVHSDPEIRRVMDRWEEEANARIRNTLALWKDRIRTKDLEAAAVLIYETLEAAVHRIKLYGLDIREERLVHELSDMLYRYLFNKTEG